MSAVEVESGLGQTGPRLPVLTHIGHSALERHALRSLEFNRVAGGKADDRRGERVSAGGSDYVAQND
jgi:hypothetical protein